MLPTACMPQRECRMTLIQRPHRRAGAWRAVSAHIDTPHRLKPDGFSVLRRGQRRASPKALPKPFYILGGVVIAVQARAAAGATVPADG
jgi:hypothetical protein